MAESASVRCRQLAVDGSISILGALCAWPIFLFVGAGGVRVSLVPEWWRWCALGLPRWSGMPLPLVLPIVTVLALTASLPELRRWPWRLDRRDMVAGLWLLAPALLLVVAGLSRGLQLLFPLLLLAAIPLLLQLSSLPAFLRGWLVGGLLFLGLQLLSVWKAAGLPLLLAHASVVPGVAGDWGTSEAVRIWGLCVYQALMTVPDLALALATVCGLKAITTFRNRPRLALAWCIPWLAALTYAFNLGRTSALLIFALQLLLALWKWRSALGPLLTLVPGLPLAILAAFSFSPFRPVLLDRFALKLSGNALLDRLPIWAKTSETLSAHPSVLISGASLDTPGTHSLLGDVLFRIGVPLAILYFLALVVLVIRAVAACSAQASPAARSGLALLLVIPVVQSVINASLLQPFSLFNVVLAALALVTFV